MYSLSHNIAFSLHSTLAKASFILCSESEDNIYDKDKLTKSIVNMLHFAMESNIN